MATLWECVGPFARVSVKTRRKYKEGGGYFEKDVNNSGAIKYSIINS